MWDVCRWAIDAQLHFDTANGRMLPTMNRSRATSVIVFCAYVGAVVAGLAFGKMLEYDDFRQLLQQDPQVRAAYWMLYAAAFIALLAVLLAGLPIAFAAARSAMATKRWGLIALFAVPPLSLALWLGAGAVTVWLTPGDFVSKPLVLRLIVGGVFVGGFGLAAIASAAAISVLVIRSAVNERLFRFARIPALIAAVAMVVMVAAILLWGVAARAADPGLFGEDNGLLASNTTVSWLLILVLMALAAAVAVAAVIQGNRAGDGGRTSRAIASQTAR
jgi:MFS family permease